jgi:hypothetical protein
MFSLNSPVEFFVPRNVTVSGKAILAIKCLGSNPQLSHARNAIDQNSII